MALFFYYPTRSVFIPPAAKAPSGGARAIGNLKFKNRPSAPSKPLPTILARGESASVKPFYDGPDFDLSAGT